VFLSVVLVVATVLVSTVSAVQKLDPACSENDKPAREGKSCGQKNVNGGIVNLVCHSGVCDEGQTYKDKAAGDKAKTEALDKEKSMQSAKKAASDVNGDAGSGGSTGGQSSDANSGGDNSSGSASQRGGNMNGGMGTNPMGTAGAQGGAGSPSGPTSASTGNQSQSASQQLNSAYSSPNAAKTAGYPSQQGSALQTGGSNASTRATQQNLVDNFFRDNTVKMVSPTGVSTQIPHGAIASPFGIPNIGGQQATLSPGGLAGGAVRTSQMDSFMTDVPGGPGQSGTTGFDTPSRFTTEAPSNMTGFSSPTQSGTEGTNFGGTPVEVVPVRQVSYSEMDTGIKDAVFNDSSPYSDVKISDTPPARSDLSRFSRSFEIIPVSIVAFENLSSSFQGGVFSTMSADAPSASSYSSFQPGPSYAPSSVASYSSFQPYAPGASPILGSRNPDGTFRVAGQGGSVVYGAGASPTSAKPLQLAGSPAAQSFIDSARIQNAAFNQQIAAGYLTNPACIGGTFCGMAAQQLGGQQLASLQPFDQNGNPILNDASSLPVAEQVPSKSITGQVSCYGSTACGDSPNWADSHTDSKGKQFDPETDHIVAVPANSPFKYGDNVKISRLDENGNVIAEDIAQVRDFCPGGSCKGNRVGDVSQASAQTLGFDKNNDVFASDGVSKGTARVRIDALSDTATNGPGKVASLDGAYANGLNGTPQVMQPSSLTQSLGQQAQMDQQSFNDNLRAQAEKAQTDLYWAQAQPAIVKQWGENDFVPSSGNVTPSNVTPVSGVSPSLSPVNVALDSIVPSNTAGQFLPQIAVSHDGALTDAGGTVVHPVSGEVPVVTASPDLPNPIAASPFGLNSVQAREGNAYDFSSIADRLPLGRLNPALGSSENVIFSTGGGFTAPEITTNDVMSGNLDYADVTGGAGPGITEGGASTAHLYQDEGTVTTNHPTTVLNTEANTGANTTPSLGGFERDPILHPDTEGEYGALDPRPIDSTKLTKVTDATAYDALPQYASRAEQVAVREQEQADKIARTIASSRIIAIDVPSYGAPSFYPQQQYIPASSLYEMPRSVPSPYISQSEGVAAPISSAAGTPAQSVQQPVMGSSANTAYTSPGPIDPKTIPVVDQTRANQQLLTHPSDTGAAPPQASPQVPAAQEPATKEPLTQATDGEKAPAKEVADSMSFSQAVTEKVKSAWESVKGSLGLGGSPAPVGESANTESPEGESTATLPPIADETKAAADRLATKMAVEGQAVSLSPADVPAQEVGQVRPPLDEIKATDGTPEKSIVATEVPDASAPKADKPLNQANPGDTAGIKGANGTQSGESGKAAVTGLTPPGGADAPPAGPGPKSPNGPAAPGGGNATNGANGNNSNGKSALGDAAGLLKSAMDMVKGLMGGGGGSGSGAAPTPTTPVTANPATVLATPVPATQFTPAPPLTPAPKILIVANPNPVKSGAASTISWQAQWDDAQPASTTRECAVADVHGKILADHTAVADSLATPALAHAAYFVIGCKQSGGKLGSTMILIKVAGDSVVPDAPPSALPAYQSTSGLSTAGSDLAAALYGSVPSTGSVPASNSGQQPQQQPKNVACDPNSSQYFECLTGKMQFVDKLY
jgi:hypothetical protein